MSKGKKGKGSADTGTTFDDGLTKEVVNDNEWQGSLIFLVPSSPSCVAHIRALTASANDGNRKKFYVIDKEWLLQMAIDDAKLATTAPTGGGKKSKQGLAAPVDKIPHVQVCQQISNCLANKEAISSSLMAKLLKYAVLKRRKNDVTQKEPSQKELAESTKLEKSKKGTSSGRASKAGKKGKDTPLPDVSSLLPIPEKPSTEMKKRGEENVDSKYLNDEPDNGPTCYILVTGLTSVDVYNELETMKLSPLALVKFTDSDPPSPNGADVVQEESMGTVSLECSSEFSSDFFPKLIALTNSSRGDSVLQDMALLELNISNTSQFEEDLESYGQQLFDSLAMRLYLVLDQYWQFKQYLKFLDVQPLEYAHDGSHDDSSGHSVEHSLLSDIPEKCCTVQLILYNMLEQVCSRQGEGLTIKDSDESDKQDALMSQFDSMLSSLQPSEDDKENTVKNSPPLVVSGVDERATEMFATALSHSEQVKIIEIHKRMTLLSDNAKYFSCLPSITNDEESLINIVKCLSQSHEMSFSDLQFALLIMSLESLHLPRASSRQVPVECTLACDEFISDCSSMQSSLMKTSSIFSRVRNLEGHHIQQFITKVDLLQILQDIQLTHPYVCVCRSSCCKCIVLIAHSGFETSGVYSTEASLTAASKVGFQSYRTNLSNAYGSYVEHLAMLERELEPEYDRTSDNPYEEEKLHTEMLNSSIPVYQSQTLLTMPQKITAYELGGRAVVGKDSNSTVITEDGILIHSQQNTIAEGNLAVMTSVCGKQLTVRSNLLWKSEVEEACSNSSSVNKREHPFECPQLPPNLISANVCALIHQELFVSASLYGPKGDGNLPFLPAKLENSSISQSQLGASPQKLSKKQQDQHQQLLDQRLLEEQLQMKQRKSAAKQYETDFNFISKNNVHQQVFATTSDGLHLHCQIIQDSELGNPELERVVLVRQSSFSCKDPNLNYWLHEEKERCYLPNGKLVRFMSDGTVQIFSPDGTIIQTASKSQLKFFNNQDIHKNLVETEPVRSSISEITIELASMNKLWLVTTPLGERYLWKDERGPINCFDESNDSNESTIADAEQVYPKEHVVFIQPLNICKTTDPVSKEVYISREDGVTLLYQPSGSLLVQHVDGTRIATTRENESSSTVLIECPSFASVLYDLSTCGCTIDVLNGISIKCDSNGEYSFLEDERGILDLKANGEAKCYSESGQYSLMHSGSTNIVTLHDKKGHLFTVDCYGKGSMNQDDSSMEVTTNEAFRPRFFIIDSYGGCSELLDNGSVDATIKQAKEDLHTKYVDEVIPTVGTVTTVFESCKNSYSKQVKVKDIVPANLRLGDIEKTERHHSAESHVFGTLLDHGLSSNTGGEIIESETSGNSNPIKYKQFLHRQPVTSEVKTRVSCLIENFRKRSESESVDAINCEKSHLSNDLDQSKLSHLYEQAIRCKNMQLDSPHDDLPSEVHGNMLAAKNVNEINELKPILQKQWIPPYPYTSIKQPTEEPDMKDLASKLATVPLNSQVSIPVVSSNGIPAADFSTNEAILHNQTKNVLWGEKVTSTSVHKDKSLTPGQLLSHALYTSSITTTANCLQYIEVSPSDIYFGTLEDGYTYQVQFSLKNIGLNPCRFTIKQPPPTTGIKVVYSPGQIAAGMTRLVTVELFAIASPTVGQSGRSSINYTLEICSDMNTLHLPIKADILGRFPTGTEPQLAKGVKTLFKNTHK